MPKYFYIKNSNPSADSTQMTITTEDAPFASGGEGDLYKVISGGGHSLETPLVIKVYKPEKQTAEKERKLDYLIAHPPALQASSGHRSVIWINQIVYEGGRFAGFVMPFAKGVKLEMLCTPKLPRTLGQEWQRFDFNNPESTRLRLSLCFNIAAAVFQVHSTGSYVLTDLKPENVIVQSNGFISLVDIDSVQVSEGVEMLFPATAATPEYTPPEYYKGLRPEKDIIEESWDRFSLAVIFYKLLFGIHPFTGNNHKPPYHVCQTLADMIEHGLFPFGSKAQFLGMVPPPHAKFRTLEKPLQSMFIRCFDQGHEAPYLRPSADEWCSMTSPRQFAAFVHRPLPSSNAALPSDLYSGALMNWQTLPALPELKEHVVQIASTVQFKELSANRWFLIMVMVIQIITVIQSNVFPVKSATFFMVLSVVITWLMYLMNVDNAPRKKVKTSLQQLGKKKVQHQRSIADLREQLTKAPVSDVSVQDYIKKYNETLLSEKKQLEQITAPFIALLSEKDAQHRAYCEQEMAELQKAENEFNQRLSNWQNRMEELYRMHIQPIDAEYRTLDRAVADKIAALMESERKKRTALMLEADEIQKEIENIALKFSAIEATEVRQIKNKAGLGFTVNEAEENVKKIQQELKRQEQEAREKLLQRRQQVQEEFAMLPENFAQQRQELNDRRAVLQQEYNHKYRNAQELKTDLSAEQNQLKQEAAKAFDEIRQRYDALHKPMLAEIAAQREKVLRQCHSLNTDTKLKLGQHTGAHSQEVMQSLIAIDKEKALSKYKINSDLASALQELDTLNYQEARLQGELQSYEAVNFTNYLKKIFSFK